MAVTLLRLKAIKEKRLPMISSNAPTPLVSIIIPAYNAGQFIAETLKSIQEQTVSNWEAIVVDDNSTDNTADVVHAAQALDPRIHYHKAPTRGGRASVNRNIGILLSKGEYITFMDADDVYYPDGLEILLAPLQQNPQCTASMAFPYYCDSELKPLHVSRHLIQQSDGRFTFDPEHEINWENICTFKVVFSVCGTLFRRSEIERLGPMDETLLSGEDYQYLVNLFRWDWDKVAILPKVSFKYRQYSGSVTKSPQLLLDATASHIKGTNWIFDLPELPGNLRALRHFHVYKRLSVVAASLTKLDRRDLAFQVIVDSLRYPGFRPLVWMQHFGKEVVRVALPHFLQDICSIVLRTNKVDYYKV
jgi:glycosyltransferase involved in cell wall biosynthesis